MENKVYLMEIDEQVPFSAYEKFMSFLSEAQRQKIERRKAEMAKKLTLISNVFVRMKATEILGIQNQDLQFSQNEFGKPYLVNTRQFHFNISHTKNALAIAIADTEIGVDIEKIKKFNPKIAERYFTKEEAVYLKNHSTAVDFFETWTKKEAYLKWLGTGLSTPLNSFNTLELKNVQTTHQTDYIISVCCDSPVQFETSIFDVGPVILGNNKS